MHEGKMMEMAEMALAAAREAGASEAAAGVSYRRQVELAVRDETLESSSESTAQALSLEVWAEGRYASVSSTDLRGEAILDLAAQAVALARALQPDPSRRLPEPALFAERPGLDLQLYDPAVAALDGAAREALCREANAAMLGQPRVISATSALSDGESRGVRATSNGFRGFDRRSWVWLSSEVTLRDEEGRPEGYHSVGGPWLGELPAAGAVGAEALRRAQERLGSRKGPSGRRTMVVEARAAGALLGRLLAPATGQAVQQGRSVWAGKLDQALLSPRLSVDDDPLQPRLPGSRLFDGEGITARRLPLIEGGALRSLYLDTTYARRLGMAPTTGAPSNRLVRPGSRDLDALVAGVADGVLVSSWLGGNADPTTGDFSLGLRGQRILKGRRAEPVGEMNLTGNLLSLFAALAEVGSDPWPWGASRCPSLVFEGAELSGA